MSLEQFRESYVRSCSTQAGKLFDRLLRKCESPIEQRLLAALLALDLVAMPTLEQHGEGWLAWGRKCGEARRPSMHALLTPDEFNGADGHLFIQAPALGYRLDFAVAVPSWNGRKRAWRWIAVECDGHEFHERTKEQALHDRKRDRAFASDGWTVVRFTGSELHADASSCAHELIHIAASRAEAVA